MIDVHTHILPNLDDGSRSIDETFSMIREAYNAGFSDIITTSHYIENEYDIDKDDRQMIINAIQRKLEEENLNIKLHNGAEIYVTPEILDFIQKSKVPTLANSRYVLFELPMHSKILYLDKVLKDLIDANYVPVIAHPERYDIVQQDVNVALDWYKKGAILQCNYASIIERYGHKAQQTLLKLLDKDAVTFLGTDTHRSSTNYIKMNEILEQFEKRIGADRLEELVTYNPKKILENKLVYNKIDIK